MKGCLKLTSPMPTQGLGSEIQHLDSLNGGGAQCCHSPTTATALSSGTAISAFSCTNTNTKSAAMTQCQSQSQSQTHRKCVAFCAQGSETVYTADEWDRTPTEPARKLSYQDLLELKEIQRSLPHADQPPDITTGRPGKQFLSGVPIVLLPLLGSGASTNGGGGEGAGGAQEGEAKKPPSPGYFSNAHGHTNGNGNGNGNANANGWGPPSLTGFRRQAQAQATPVRPSFPFPPRPVPLSAPASTPTFTSARAPAPVSPSPITQPLRTSFQSQNKTGASSTSLSPSSSYSNNRPSSTSTSPTYPYANRPPQIQTQAQSRMPWTPPPSLSHLMPSSPVKPREKPKFEFVTLLDTGARSGGGSASPSAIVPPGGANGVGNVEEATITKVGPEVALQHTSKLPSGLIGIEGLSEKDHHNEHDLEDHDLISVTSSSSSCPSLCASSCPSSCSTSEVDTDHEADIETEGRHTGFDRYGYAIRLRGKGCVDGNNDGGDKPTNSSSLRFPFLPGPDVGLALDEGKRDKVMMKKKPKLKKEKKFILVNDMEIELDDSESESEEEDSPVLSGRTGTIQETSTTKIERTKTTASGGNPSSPRSIAAPAPVKSALWGSRPPAPSSSASASLITPPTTPPSEHMSRYGSHTNNHSPTSSSSSTTSRGRKKGQIVGGSASRERSRSMCSDTSSGGGGGRSSPSRSTRKVVESPVKLKSKVL